MSILDRGVHVEKQAINKVQDINTIISVMYDVENTSDIWMDWSEYWQHELRMAW